MGKGENAGKQHFLLCPQGFLLLRKEEEREKISNYANYFNIHLKKRFFIALDQHCSHIFIIIAHCSNRRSMLPDAPPFLNPFPNDRFRLFQTEKVCKQQFQI